MPEQAMMSITVTVAPRLAGGLDALAAKHLSGGPSSERDRPARTIINNTSTGDVHGTLFQIGNVGSINTYDGR
ncbi:hypothetical protein [Lentzea sp. E54]|uniref:hypothetical protein n=1 Tax=Lentzea xerophila TaxID=3435883 RepID=UPI003DA1EFA1